MQIKFKDEKELSEFFRFLCKHFPRAVQHNYEKWRDGKTGKEIV